MRKTALLAITLLFLSTACTGEPPPTCTDHFFNGTSPVITKQSLTNKAQQLCFEGNSVMHSGISRTPIWSAEHLTADRIGHARQMKRLNAFHAEEQLSLDERAELKDYVRSGFDRGHMAPSGDMPTEAAQHESFSLANMIPQNPKNNQILWEGIEEATRTLASDDGEIYVITGPIFEGSSLQRINGRVLVPTAVFKAIYDPIHKRAGAYVTTNAAGMEYQTLSITDLETRIGINVFPTLAAQVKKTKMKLPAPTPHGARRGKNVPVEVD